MRFLPILCAVLPAVHAQSPLRFGVTGPDASEPLDLSKPVEITWTTTEGQIGEPLARALSLWFHAVGTSGSRFGQELQRNLSLSAESYTWDPSSWVENMRDNNDIRLSAGREHYIEFRLTRLNGERLVTTTSDKYIITGVSDLIGAAGNVAVSKAVVGIVTGLAVLKGLLL